MTSMNYVTTLYTLDRIPSKDAPKKLAFVDEVEERCL